LVEAAAQHSIEPNHIEKADRFLKQACQILNDYPLAQPADRDILRRALIRYADLAEKYTGEAKIANSNACLKRILDFARLDAAVLHWVSSYIGELGEKWEIASADRVFADSCYTVAVNADPAAHWFRYRQSRIALARLRLGKVFRELFALAREPSAPKAVLDKLLSPQAAVRLAPFWPTSSKSILKPFFLCLAMSFWAARRVIHYRRREFLTVATATLLVFIFVTRHFGRMLQLEINSLRRSVYKARRRHTAR